MEWAIVFGALCTITDCAWQRIDRSVLLLGILAGSSVTAFRLWQGILDWHEVLWALLPGLMLWIFCVLSEGKLGRGDGDMTLVLGLLLGWELCLAVLCTACMLTAVFAGVGLAAGRLKKNSRIPFAPFLLGAMALLWVYTMKAMPGR